MKPATNKRHVCPKTSTRALKGVTIIVFIALLAPSCQSASKQEMEVMRNQVANIDKRVGNMANIVANLDQLQNAITTLTGQIEELNERSSRLSEKISKMERGGSSQSDILKRTVATNIRLEKLNEKLNTLNAETMAFIALMEKKSGISSKRHKKAVAKILVQNGNGSGHRKVVSNGGNGKKASVTTAKVSPDELYKEAYNSFLKGSYKEAIKGFTGYLSSFPKTELSDNAAYWLGESKYRIPDYVGSVKAFDQMVQQYPKSNKAPAALLRAATASFKNKDENGGLQRLRSLLESYPTSNEALTASERLDQAEKKAN